MQNEFLRLRFNQLPKNDIITFLKKISDNEELNISNHSLSLIQHLYGSDMRSMINFIQSNQNKINNTINNFNIIDITIWDELFNKFISINNHNILDNYIEELSINYNIDKKNIIKDFLNYIIRNKPHIISKELLCFIENIMHNQDCKISCYINYSLLRLSSFIYKE